MATDVNLERRAAIVLHERAVRQALVDRLTGPSSWRQLAGPMFLPAAWVIFFLLLSNAPVRELVPSGNSLMAFGLAVVFWLIAWLVQATFQLRALTAILEKSGALSRFVEDAVTPSKDDRTR
jgi:uncharacterized protein YjeT (DUF2065 family)